MPSRKAFRSALPAVLLFALGLAPSASVAQPPASKSEGGSRSSHRPYVTPGSPKRLERIRTFDVRHIKGDITIDPKALEVRGTVTHNIAPLHPGLDTVTLDCAKELDVSRVTVGPKDKPKTCKTERKDDTLTVTLDRPYAPDETFDLAVTYSGKPEQGLYFITPDPSVPGRPLCVWSQGEAEETRHWLPCYDFPNDRATSEMTVTVPRPLTVLSNGSLVETKENADGTSTFHWKMDVPHVSYLISVVASEFNVVRDKAGALPVEYYVLKNVDEATARRSLGKTPKMVGFFESVTGQPYPYVKYAQAIVPEFTQGGMENITATTLNEYALIDEVEALERDSDSLVAHELAHQWFGDLLTCKDWPHLWLNEGFASYFDPLFGEFDGGDDEFRLAMNGIQAGYLGGDQFQRRAIVEPRYRDTMDLFDGVTYSKGACVLHALRGLVGDDAWWRGIKAYVAAHKRSVVETDDFRKAMETASGRDLAWFFDQWVFHGGHPELKARWRFEPEDKTLRLTVEQVQTVDELTPLFRLPTTVAIDDGTAVRSVPVVIDGKSHEFVIPCPSPPKMVRLDPKAWLIKTLDFTKPTEEWVYQLGHATDALGRLEAFRALAGKKDDPKAAAAMIKAVAGETVSPAKVLMTTQLGNALGESARETLIEGAKGKDAKVRRVAFTALARLKADGPVEELFRKALADPKEAFGVRNAALRGLAGWKVKDRDELIADALKDASGDYSRAAAALSLRLADPAKGRETAVLYSKLGQPLPLRRPSVFALSRFVKDDPQVENALLTLASDPSRVVRQAAWSALGRQQGSIKGALEALETQLKRETNAPARVTLAADVARIKKSRESKTDAAKPATTATPTFASKPAATTSADELERQTAALEGQVKELRRQIEALKAKPAEGSATKP